MSSFIRRIVSRVVWCSFIAAALMIGGAVAVYGQGRGIALSSPGPNTTVAPGTQVNLKALIKTLYPKIVRVDFRANGVLIGSGTGNNWSAVWTPSTGGNYNITAEAITIGNTIALTSKPTQLAVLTVLYDKLGGPGNWGFDTANAYRSWFDNLESDYFVVTQFIGSLASPVTLQRFEIAMRAFDPSNPGTSFDLANYTFKLKIWNASVGSFTVDALNPSLASYTLGSINLGSTTVPVGTTVNGRPIFHIGWDNLNITLPSNVPLELSLQASVSSGTEQVASFASIIPGPDMITAVRIGATNQTNAIVPQPMAAKLSVVQ